MKRSKEERVKIIAGGRIIHADLLLPPSPEGVIIFSHFYQSMPAERRHRLIAEVQTKYNFAALLFDLTPEGKNPEPVFSELVSFSKIILSMSDFISKHPDVSGKPLGIFSSSTGIVPAFIAASEDPRFKAIVSRGPVPNIPVEVTSRMELPVLLLAGAKDSDGVQSNLKVYEDLSGPRDLKIITGASATFQELGKLGEVAHLSANWFSQYLSEKKAIPA